MTVTIHTTSSHFGWDNQIEPAIRAEEGNTVELVVQDASGGQITPTSTAGDLGGLRLSHINPVTGPVFVNGAHPGDALKVTMRELRPSGWGWTAIIPRFGLLADEFPDPVLHLWDYDPSASATAFGPHAMVPLRPFTGTIGVAPSAPGLHSVIPPRHVGGNMDVRDVHAGTVLYLPVEVEGALLSVGDTHAAQGDGEVCGTALESPMDVVLTLEVESGRGLPAPMMVTPATSSSSGGWTDADAGRPSRGSFVTTGIGPDLLTGARDAVRYMLDVLGREARLAPEVAYMLCSVAAHLRIGEVVNAPHWLVCCELPRQVLEG